MLASASKIVRGDNVQQLKGRTKRTVSTAHGGLQGLRFLDKAGGREGDGWKAVEKRFNQFADGGRLSKENFGRCIGEPWNFTLKNIHTI